MQQQHSLLTCWTLIRRLWMEWRTVLGFQVTSALVNLIRDEPWLKESHVAQLAMMILGLSQLPSARQRAVGMCRWKKPSEHW
ncbi:hypothetical protein EYF80_021995 [Liparis tanakae]|uniref:Uncharacterized protein n=1 Tax=Liparis tanakae TaxID=230148 RepID=A0A4Z2HQI4_9TELE|nr:hypothetical protein EYF80_021995 [Liparis tanakae]